MYATMNACRKQGRAPWTVAIALAVLGAGPAMSDELHGGKDCTAATIRGTYGIQMQGTRPVPPPTGGIENVVGVVVRTYDGYGNFTQVDNIKGSVTGIVPDRPGAGTYEVFPDCSGTTTFQPDPGNPALVIQEKFLILESGDELRGIAVTPPPLMITNVARRMSKR